MSRLGISGAVALDPAFVVSLVLYVTIVAAVAVVVDAGLKRSAVVRHAILASALLMILLSPLSVALLRHWDVVGLRFRWAGISVTERENVPERVSPAGNTKEMQPLVQGPERAQAIGADVPDRDGVLVESTTDIRSRTNASLNTFSETFPPVEEREEAPGARPQSGVWEGVTTALPSTLRGAMAIWVAGTLVLLLRITRGVVQLRSMLRDARPVSESDVQRQFRAVCRWFRIRAGTVALLESDRVDMPIAVGGIDPRIVIPIDLVSLRDPRSLREVFVHELAHIARRDHIIVWGQHVVAALFWWHPMVHRLNRRLAQSREELCDNYVLRVSSASHYGRTLLALTQRRLGAGIPSTVVGLFSSRWKLEQRVEGLLDRNRRRSTRLSRRGGCVVLGALVLAFALSSQSSVTFAIEKPPVRLAQSDNDKFTDGAEADQVDAPAAAFRGTVLDHRGKPAEQATVILNYRKRGDQTSHRKVTQTDSSGVYRFERLPHAPSEMEYQSLLVWLPEHAFMRRTNYSFSADASNNDDPITSDFSLVKATESVIVVVDEQDEPVSGVTLDLVNTNGDAGSNVWVQADEWKLFGIDTPVTDELGRMTIPGIDHARSYDLRIAHPGYAATPIWNVEFRPDPRTVVIEKGQEVRFMISCESDPNAVAQAKIEISVSELGGHSLLKFDVDSSGVVKTRLRDRHATITIEHPTLAGLPWYFYDTAKPEMPFRLYPTGEVKGRVVDPATGNGVEGVPVQFVREQRVIAQVRSDADGNYQCSLAATSYHATIDSLSGKWEASEQRVPFGVIASQSTTINDLTAKSGAMIRGRVVLESGQPVRSAIVVQNFRRDAVLTDENGRFELEPERSAAFPIQVLHPYEKVSRVVSSPADGGELSIPLSAEGVLVGVLRDASGKTLPNFEAGLGAVFGRSAGRRGGFVSTILETLPTDEQGFVRFVGLSKGFDYRLSVGRRLMAGSTSRGETRSQTFSVADLPSLPIEIEVDEQQQIELKSQTLLPDASETLLPFGSVTWLGKRRMNVESFGGRYLVVSTAGFPQQLWQSELASQLYGDRGLVVVGVLGSMMKDMQANDDVAKQFSFPIAIDNDQSRVMERYGLASPGDVAIYNARGDLVRSVRRGMNLVPIVRNLMLYGE